MVAVWMTLFKHKIESGGSPSRAGMSPAAGRLRSPARAAVTNISGYPEIQFVTDNSATQLITSCNPVTGSGCVLPPKGPGHFYPYFTQAMVRGLCV
jgi:hypothetical protein